MAASAGVEANECADHPIIGSYVHARDNDGPTLEALSPVEKERVKATYENMLAIAERRLAVATEMSGAIGGGELDSSTNKSQNDRILAANIDLIFSQLSAEQRVDYVDTFREAVSALGGNSDITFAQHNDRLNRDIAEKVLRDDGCPDDLLQDYGVPGY